jgi:hypothetical protein
LQLILIHAVGDHLLASFVNVSQQGEDSIPLSSTKVLGRFSEHEKGERREEICEALWGYLAERVPSTITDILDGESLDVSGTEEIILVLAFWTAPIVGEVRRFRAVAKRFTGSMSRSRD